MTVLGWCIALTVLEMVGAVLGRHALGAGAGWAAVAGTGVFSVLFVVYAFSLRASSLTTVTVGWIVVSQLTAVGVDWCLYGHTIGWKGVAGIGLVLSGVAVMAG